MTIIFGILVGWFILGEVLIIWGLYELRRNLALLNEILDKKRGV